MPVRCQPDPLLIAPDRIDRVRTDLAIDAARRISGAGQKRLKLLPFRPLQGAFPFGPGATQRTRARDPVAQMPHARMPIVDLKVTLLHNLRQIFRSNGDQWLEVTRQISRSMTFPPLEPNIVPEDPTLN